jgi:ATP-dependent DNA helicase RecG
MIDMNLDNPLQIMPGVGAALIKKFNLLGVRTLDDVINYYPRRYDDYSLLLPIDKLRPGQVSLQATIESVSGRYVRRGMHITEAIAHDETGSIRLVWFNQPYRAKALKTTEPYYISGTYALSRQRFSMVNPSLELVSELPLNTVRIVPIYRETKGLNSKQIRQAIAQVLATIPDWQETLPAWLIQDQTLMAHGQALKTIHFPTTKAQLSAAQLRLSFEEVFHLTLASLLNKQAEQHEQGMRIPFEVQLAKQFVASLPFALTDDQRKVIWRIYQDMERPQPMNRLVEGDVGSGKTVVAAMAAVMVLAAQKQVTLMAPTELLARQHAETIHRLLEPLGLANQVGLLVGSLATKQKASARLALAKGETRFMIGTQALITEQTDTHDLGLIIVDEQHRFGVDQRKKLQAKAGHMPHVLSLTATPIPRSLALTLYGELDVSIIQMKPAGRQPIITEIISPNSRAQLYAKIDIELAAGRQMFVVCPLISESTVLDVNSAEQVYEQLASSTFKHRRVGLLHGKMKPAEKISVMDAFVHHELDILVSTTVIEVGVDIPNASIMLLEAAERFGLAQIHQLRGRVGRGVHQGYCYLLQSDSKPASQRLRALEQSSDGFKLAELDLELRGPGAIYGTMQHGALDLRIAKLTDVKLIAIAREAAQSFIDRGENLLDYKQLAIQIARLRAVTNLN